MAHSIEARVPFLDYRLVEYVLGLPDEFRIAGGVSFAGFPDGDRLLRPAAAQVIEPNARGLGCRRESVTGWQVGKLA